MAKFSPEARRELLEHLDAIMEQRRDEHDERAHTIARHRKGGDGDDPLTPHEAELVDRVIARLSDIRRSAPTSKPSTRPRPSPPSGRRRVR